MKIKLYEISKELETLYSIPIDGDEEGVNWQAFEELLAELTTKFLDKVDDTVGLLKSWQVDGDMIEAQAAVLVTEAKRLKDKAKARYNAAEMLKEYIKKEMIKENKTKIKTNMYTVYIQKSKDVVEVYDEDLLPEGCYKKSPEKAKIEKIIKSGEEVPGARMTEGTEFLQIK